MFFIMSKDDDNDPSAPVYEHLNVLLGIVAKLQDIPTHISDCDVAFLSIEYTGMYPTTLQSSLKFPAFCRWR